MLTRPMLCPVPCDTPALQAVADVDQLVELAVEQVAAIVAADKNASFLNSTQDSLCSIAKCVMMWPLGGQASVVARSAALHLASSSVQPPPPGAVSPPIPLPPAAR